MPKAITLAALLLAALAGCADTDSSSATDPNSRAGPAAPAPGFELTDANGQAVRFGGARERPVIVLFWATWCPYCKQLMPHLQSIVDEYDGQIEVLALNVFEDDDPVAFLAEHGYQFRLLPNADSVAPAYQVKGTPGLFLIDRAGQIRFDLSKVPREPSDETGLKRWQQAARVAPHWAAELRQAIDRLL